MSIFFEKKILRKPIPFCKVKPSQKKLFWPVTFKINSDKKLKFTEGKNTNFCQNKRLIVFYKNIYEPIFVFGILKLEQTQQNFLIHLLSFMSCIKNWSYQLRHDTVRKYLYKIIFLLLIIIYLFLINVQLIYQFFFFLHTQWIWDCFFLVVPNYKLWTECFMNLCLSSLSLTILHSYFINFFKIMRT